MKILMVCLGNICRSPIAEGVMRSKFIKYHLDGMVDSAGIIDFHSGQAPDKRAIATAGKYDIDISQQVARQLKSSDLNEFDLILSMDQSVHDDILQQLPHGSAKDKVHLFLSYAGNQSQTDVPDPYYGGQEGFEKVFRMIDDHCEKIIRKIQKTGK